MKFLDWLASRKRNYIVFGAISILFTIICLLVNLTTEGLILAIVIYTIAAVVFFKQTRIIGAVLSVALITYLSSIATMTLLIDFNSNGSAMMASTFVLYTAIISVSYSSTHLNLSVKNRWLIATLFSIFNIVLQGAIIIFLQLNVYITALIALALLCTAILTLSTGRFSSVYPPTQSSFSSETISLIKTSCDIENKKLDYILKSQNKDIALLVYSSEELTRDDTKKQSYSFNKKANGFLLMKIGQAGIKDLPLVVITNSNKLGVEELTLYRRPLRFITSGPLTNKRDIDNLLKLITDVKV